MSTEDARIVRGLSIANIVLSSLGILLWLIVVIATIAAGSVATNADLYTYSSSGYTTYEHYGPETASAVAGVAVGIAALFFAIGVVMAVVALIASIKGLKIAEQPAKASNAFIWAIVGAVVSFLSGGAISTVLFVIAAVYLNRIKAAMNPQQGYAQAPYQQPYNQAPVPPAQQPYAAPQQGAPTAQPYAVPQQPQQAPVQAAAPTQPEPVQATAPAQPEPTAPAEESGPNTVYPVTAEELEAEAKTESPATETPAEEKKDEEK